ncbi:NAD(P)-dependent oxidoreductase [Streptomyces sp. NPDC091281]|uniref:NAD(P)-dependent oxidoreductase n=1 Tax=Streptomyces sp. NPDC091281 TaxID=3365985 RepID=UPI0037F25FDF
MARPHVTVIDLPGLGWAVLAWCFAFGVGLAGAALDVFTDEPLRPDSPLLGCDRVLLSPHLAGETGSAHVRLLGAVRDNVRRVLTGWPSRHTVTDAPAHRNPGGPQRPADGEPTARGSTPVRPARDQPHPGP